MKIAIVGSGITGLSAALTLEKSGHSVTVFERREQTGGAVRSVRQDGWLLEYGPNTLQLKSQPVYLFLRDLGLTGELVDADKEASKRYVVSGGELVRVPSGFTRFLRTPLFSNSGKLRIMREPFVRRGDDPDETVASFVERRVGREFLDHGVDPLIAGIYAGSPDQLLIRHTFPTLYMLEQRYGSLTAGMAAQAWNRRKKDSFQTRLVSFTGGLQSLTDKITNRLKDVRCGEDVHHIKKGDNGWDVVANDTVNGGFDQVLLNIPLYKMSDTLIEGGGSLAVAEESLSYPPLSIIYTGYRREQISHPLDGFGFLVPGIEKRKILGTLFNSTLFPERAPEGHVLLTTFVGGTRQPDTAGKETGELVELVKSEHRELLGLKGEPVMTDHVFWPRSIPQYSKGYDRVLEAAERLEAENEGLSLAGNFRGGVSVPDCIGNGVNWAESLPVLP